MMRGLALATGALQFCLAAAAGAQDFPPAYRDAFKGRITQSAAITTDATKAGYYRVVFRQMDLNNATNCPRNDAERDKLARVEKTLWQFVFNKKRDWGITAEVEFPATAAGAEGPTKLETGLILIKKAGTNECSVTLNANVDFASPLIPLKSYYYHYGDRVQVNLLNWYGEKADDSRINLLWKGIGAALNFVAPGASLIADSALKRGEDETRSIVNERITSNLPYPMTVGSSYQPLFVRLGPAPEGTEKPGGVLITLDYVGSVFGPGAVYPDLSNSNTGDLLKFSVGKPAKKIDERVDQTTYTNLNKQTDVKGFEAACEPMFVELSRIGLSDVDQAVFVWAMAMENTKVGKWNVQFVKCLTARAQLLRDTVKITIDHGTDTSLLVAATYKQMTDSLFALTRLARGSGEDGDLDYLAPDNIQLSGELALIGLPGVGNTVMKRDEVVSRLFAAIDRNGCWAPDSSNKDAVFTVPTGMIGVDLQAQMRLAGSAALLKDKTATAIIYRFAGTAPDGSAKISGLHFTTRPGTDFVASFRRPGCSSYDWIPRLTAP